MPFLLNDSLQYLSKLTPRRTINIAKVLSSYFVSKYFKKPVQWGYANFRVHRAHDIVQPAVPGMSQRVAFIYTPYGNAEDESV